MLAALIAEVETLPSRGNTVLCNERASFCRRKSKCICGFLRGDPRVFCGALPSTHVFPRGEDHWGCLGEAPHPQCSPQVGSQGSARYVRKWAPTRTCSRLCSGPADCASALGSWIEYRLALGPAESRFLNTADRRPHGPAHEGDSVGPNPRYENSRSHSYIFNSWGFPCSPDAEPDCSTAQLNKGPCLKQAS